MNSLKLCFALSSVAKKQMVHHMHKVNFYTRSRNTTGRQRKDGNTGLNMPTKPRVLCGMLGGPTAPWPLRWGFWGFCRHKWSLCCLVVSVLAWSTTRRGFPAFPLRTSRTRCPVSLCLENVLGFLTDAKFAHDGICRKCFPPSPVGRETLSPLARLGTLCQRSLALRKRDSPQQGTGSARGPPASPDREDAARRQRQTLTRPSQMKFEVSMAGKYHSAA